MHRIPYLSHVCIANLITTYKTCSALSSDHADKCQQAVPLLIRFCRRGTSTDGCDARLIIAVMPSRC